MPNLFAHVTLGKRALEAMPTAQLQVAKAAPNPFAIGLQGPDVFFYGSVLRDRTATEFGEGLHFFSGRALLEKFRSQYRSQDRDKPMPVEVRAYLMGFTGHYTLDVMAHPYVGQVQTSEATHLALESDFDVYLLTQVGIIPWKNRLYKLCPKDRGTQAALAEAYAPWHEEISGERVAASVRDLHNIRHLMRTPNRLKFRLLRRVMEAKGIYNKLYGMLIPPPEPGQTTTEIWPDRPADSLTTLDDILTRALPIYLENLTALDRYLDEDLALPAFFDHDFSGNLLET